MESNEQFNNAMMLAMDAYNANNEPEAKAFCNQALVINPKSSQAKALKGAAILISFSLAGAVSDAEEALSIWESLDASSITENDCKIITDAVFDFLNRWRNAAEAHYKKFKSVDSAKQDFKNVKESIITFMNRIAACEYMCKSPYFIQCAIADVKSRASHLSDSCVDYAYALTKTNEDETGELGELTKQLNEILNKGKKTKMIKWGIIIVIAIIYLICAFIGM